MTAADEYKEIVTLLREQKAIADELRGNVGAYGEVKKEMDANQAELKKALEAISDLQEKSILSGAGGKLGWRDTDEGKGFSSFARKGVKTMATNDGPVGGYLVVGEVASEILRLAQDDNVIRTLASQMTVGSGSTQIPIEDEGEDAYFIGELETRPSQTDLKYGLNNLEINDMYASVKISQNLIDDAVFNVEQDIMTRISKKFAKVEEDEFINGSGFKCPEGILVCDKVQTGNATASATAITADEVIDIRGYGEVAKSSVEKNATYLMNFKTALKLRKLKDTQGQYLWQPSLAAGMPPTFDGIPVVKSWAMPDIAASASPVAYGDFSAYRIADRKDINILRNPYRYSGQILFEFTKRVGGMVVDGNRIAKVTMKSS
ncbi:MAG: phage major capsid protein [Gudongella sp.]|jgi:HK97 family phage major capsid protein|nr:phage major capsid protein [Gudongella sp.]